jgi:uncharacterized protein with PIN domain
MFICDRTLGRLTKWLRILGFEALFLKTVDDDKLLEKVSKMKESIFITRNMNIYNKIGIKNKYFLKTDDFREQLREISKFFPGKWADNLFTRCVICGNHLDTVDKIRIMESVPEYVFETSELFKICSACDKVYWEGTHLKRINSELKTIFPNKFD